MLYLAVNITKFDSFLDDSIYYICDVHIYSPPLAVCVRTYAVGARSMLFDIHLSVHTFIHHMACRLLLVYFFMMETKKKACMQLFLKASYKVVHVIFKAKIFSQ